MKKYNKTNSFNVFWGIIIPILLFFSSVNVTFAYFTAQSASLNSSPLTAVITVSFDETTKKLNATNISSSTKIVPGDELVINTKISNSGTAPVYAIINFKLNITKTDGTTRTHLNKNYTLSGSTLTEIYGKENSYSSNAFVLEDNSISSPFDITYKFDGNRYDNSYKNATAHYEIKVNAIQKDNITQISATNYLMQQGNVEINRIYGNTVVNGTPSIETPATIQSVGDKTKNLVNINAEQTFIQFSPSSTIMFDTSKMYLSVSRNGHGSSNVYNLIVNNNTVKFSSNSGYYGIAFPISVKSNTNYTFSWINNSSVLSAFITYYSNGIYQSDTYISPSTPTSVITTPENCDLVLVGLAPREKNIEISASNIMFEEGSSASEYEPYGKYKIPMEVKSKNLVNISSDFEWTGTHIGSITLPAGTYTVSWSGSSKGSTVDPYLKLSDGITCSLKSAGGTYTFTLDSELNTSIYLYANGYNFNGSEGITSSVQNFMIEAGSTATEYDPYYQSTQNIYLDEPLRKIGNVADYIDLETGEVVRMVGKFVLDGSESWGIPYSEVEGYTPFRITNMSNWKGNGAEFICNMLEYSGNGYIKKYNCCAGYDSNSPQLFLILSNDLIPLNDTTALKQWLKDLYDNNTPMYVIHMLATPITEYVDVSNIPVGATISVLTTLAPSN